MSLSKAQTFYHLLREDINFRKACYACNSHEELETLFVSWKLNFSNEEFDEVILSCLFKCGTEEEALTVRQIEQVYYLLLERIGE